MNKSSGNSKLLSIVLLVMGLSFAAMGTGMTIVQMEVSGFEPVAAEVLEVKIDTRTNDGSRTYYPFVRYRYVVDNVQHESDKFTFVGMGGSESVAQRKIDAYQVGENVQAFYDPDDPSVAVLRKDVTYIPSIFAVVGIGILVGAWVLWPKRLAARRSYVRA